VEADEEANVPGWHAVHRAGDDAYDPAAHTEHEVAFTRGFVNPGLHV
jgi:hypothetical protein